jgi:uncharacterized pyridoxal phosphate-containing UPF0001 family protein
MKEDQDLLHILNLLNSRIQNACKKCGRNPDKVRLLLAMKTVSAERIITVLQHGQTLIAENKV